MNLEVRLHHRAITEFIDRLLLQRWQRREYFDVTKGLKRHGRNNIVSTIARVVLRRHRDAIVILLDAGHDIAEENGVVQCRCHCLRQALIAPFHPVDGCTRQTHRLLAPGTDPVEL